MAQRRWRTWRSAMTDALYGPAGFYAGSGVPARHFRTAAHVEGSAWAAALTELARRVDTALGEPPDMTVVDAGAGGGELLAGLAALAPPRWSLVGVDVAPRPADLPERVDWRPDVPAQVTGVLLAVELLDVVPCDVVERDGGALRLVEVDDDGVERLGAEPDAADARWVDRWWPVTEDGERVEVGRSRDERWRSLRSAVRRGSALAVDYAAHPERDRWGTLTGFRSGCQVAPRPDGSCDITAHVHFPSLQDDGDVVLTQRDALAELLPDRPTRALPAYEGDPTAYLAELSALGELAELRDPGGLGGFSWLLHPVGIGSPLPAESTNR